MKTWLQKYYILVILLVAFGLRLVLVDSSFWLDEAAQAIESSRPLSQQLDIAADFHPPLYHIVLHFFTLFGTSEAWLRMSSILSGLVLIYFTYRIAKLIWKGAQGKQIGLITAAFLAVSPLHLYYSQEVRMYMFVAMWATISWWALLSYLQNKRSSLLIVFTLSTAAGLYSMYLYPFVFFSQIVYMTCFRRQQLRAFLLASAVAVLTFLPWIPFFLEQLRIGSALRVSLPGWSEVVSSPQWKALFLIWAKFIGGQVPVDLTLPSLTYYVTATALLLISGFFLIQNKTKLRPLLPLITWFVATVLSAWLVSFIVPVLSVKRAVLALPPFFLIATAAFLQLKSMQWRRVAVGGFIVIELIGVLMYWSTPQLQRERWRETQQQISARYSTENTLVVFAFDAPFAPWRWYERDQPLKFATLSFPTVPVEDPQFSQVMQKALPYKTVLVFDYLRDLTDPSRKIDAWLLSHGYQQGALIDTQNMGFVREYDKQTFFSMR